MAALLEMTGRDREVLGYYKKARETKTPEGFIALANYFIQKKDARKALRVLDEAIQTIPDNIPVRVLKGRIYLSEKRFEDALRVFEDIEAISPERAFPLIINAYIANRDYKDALRKIEDRQSETPGNSDLMADVVRVYLLKGETDKAMEVANKLIKQKPRSADGYTVLAVVYMNKKNLDKALETLKEGLSVDSSNIKARMMQASLYAKKGERARAITVYEDIVKDNPRYVQAVFAEGNLYDLMGRKEDSVKKYRQVLEVAKNYVPALNNLAYLSAEGYGSREEALKLALRAYRSAYLNGSVMDTLGYVIIKNEKADDVGKSREKAVLHHPANPTRRYHLALA